MSQSPFFKDLLREVLKSKGLTQHQLALRAGVSQTSISLAGSHERKLSPELARHFSRILGGSDKFWLEAFGDYYSGKSLPVEAYLAKIDGGFQFGQELGSDARRLLNKDMIELFWVSTSNKDCRIAGFDPRRVRSSSYYTRIGTLGESDQLVSGTIALEPRQAIQVRTLEDFHLPLWIETELHPTSSLSKLGLAVEHGPIIDPGYWSGPLSVTLRNPGETKVEIDSAIPFLKLRFWVFERSAKDEEDLKKEYGLDYITDAQVLARFEA